MSTRDWEHFIEELDTSGYFLYAEPEVIAEVKAEMVQARSMWPPQSDLPTLTGRVYTGDAERLTEGGVLAFLWELGPFLQRQGVLSPVYLDQAFRPGRFAYSVTVGPKVYPMLKAEEYGECIPYVLVTGRAFALVNDLLERVGSTERLYAVNNTVGERSVGVFLTPELYRLINDSPLMQEGEKLLTPEEVINLGK